MVSVSGCAVCLIITHDGGRQKELFPLLLAFVYNCEKREQHAVLKN